jgi:hypothetical protein
MLRSWPANLVWVPEPLHGGNPCGFGFNSPTVANLDHEDPGPSPVAQSGETVGLVALARHPIAGNRSAGIAYLLPSHLQ